MKLDQKKTKKTLTNWLNRWPTFGRFFITKLINTRFMKLNKSILKKFIIQSSTYNRYAYIAIFFNIRMPHFRKKFLKETNQIKHLKIFEKNKINSYHFWWFYWIIFWKIQTCFKKSSWNWIFFCFEIIFRNKLTFIKCIRWSNKNNIPCIWIGFIDKTCTNTFDRMTI